MEAGSFFPGPSRGSGNAKWRIAWGETEEEWKRVHPPHDENGKLVDRSYSKTELEEMERGIVHVRALNRLNRYVRSIHPLVVFLSPILFAWSLVIAIRSASSRLRIAALAVSGLALACELVVQYRLWNVDLV